MSVNVLYIIDSLTHGGTEKYLVQLIKNLNTERFRPHLCTLKVSESLYEELSIPKICLNFISFSHPSIVKIVAHLSSFIRQHNIKLVQTFFQDPFLLGAMVRPFNRFKLIGAFRDLGFWRTAAETRKMRIAYPFFSGFIANSEAVKDHFVKKDRISPAKIEVIYNGIDLNTFQAKSVEDCSEKPLKVGIVANLNRPVKRVQDFILAAAQVHKERPNVQFIVVGDGYMRNALEALGNSQGLEDVLYFTGRLTNPLKVIRQFHIGVITSETEGFCNAILEYMACGVPVVATNTGGNPELVTPGENGFLYPVGDTDALAEIIQMVLSDETLRLEVLKKNLFKINCYYTNDRFIQKQYIYYEKILGNGYHHKTYCGN